MVQTALKRSRSCESVHNIYTITTKLLTLSSCPDAIVADSFEPDENLTTTNFSLDGQMLGFSMHSFEQGGILVSHGRAHTNTHTH